MKHFLRFLALFFLSISTQISAQNAAGSVEVGVYSAYQLMRFSQGTPEYSGEYDEGAYKALGYTFGCLIECRIDPMLSIVGIVGYEKVQVDNSLSVKRYRNFGIEKTPFLKTYTISAPQIQVSILIKRSLGMSNFSFLGGGIIGIVFADKQDEKYVIIDTNMQFPLSVDSVSGLSVSKGYYPHYTDETRTSITLYSGPIYKRTAFQLGLTAGLQYDIPLFSIDDAAQKFVTLTPSVLFNYNLTTYSDYEKLRAWNVSAGFVLKVGL